MSLQVKMILEVCKRSNEICLQLYEKELLTDSSYLCVLGLKENELSASQLSVLAGGLVAEGRRCFQSMASTYLVRPEAKHYGSMVDNLLHVRAGLLEEAEELIRTIVGGSTRDVM